MTQEADALPARPFFTCSPEGLVIVDGGQANNLSRLESIDPWMDFKNGDSNVIDAIPRRVTTWEGQQITVECEDSTVHIDFAEGRARKFTQDGEYVYLGTLDERNDGMGYIAVS